MQLELYHGRPEDCTGRLEKEVRTYDLLDKLGIEFWRTDHAFMKADTMEDCKVIDDCLGATVCKNLFLCNRQKTNFYLLMMPGDKPFKTKEAVRSAGHCPPELCFAGRYGALSRLHAGFVVHHGAGERPRRSCPAPDGRGRDQGRISGLSPLHQHLVAQASDEGCAGSVPSGGPSRSYLCSPDRRIRPKPTSDEKGQRNDR